MKVFPIVVVTVIVLGGGLILLLNKLQAEPTSQVERVVATPTSSPANQPIDIKASFTIVTGSITRSFTNPKYHNQSPDVYIEASDPMMVHVKKAGTTWDDFFKTLPMKLTKDCLTTGDGESYCDQKDGSLKFYLNDAETPDLLGKEIMEGDKILIRFNP